MELVCPPCNTANAGVQLLCCRNGFPDCCVRLYPRKASGRVGCSRFRWLAVWFNRLDARTRQLVEAGEDALRVSQARLANLANNHALMILDAVDEPAPGASSYRRVITVIQTTIFALFLGGFLYAVRLSFM
jgi:hypothetical protein